jgi:hypothetical protein
MSAVAEVISGLLEPGVYPELPMADYLALPYMSASRLELIRRSPLQLKHSLGQPEETSPALERGTALHLAVLEPLLFEGRYVTIGQCEGLKKNLERCSYQGSVLRNGKSFCGTHDPDKGADPDPDIEVLTEKDFNAVLGMRDAIMAHKRARSLFEGRGLFECTVIFDDPVTGVRSKIRPDRLVERAGMLTDIKSSWDACPSAFPRLAENRGYFRKLALYRRGLNAVGWPLREISVLAVEPDPPFDLAPYLIEDMKDLDAADAEITRLLALYQQCTETNTWPGYASSEDGFLMLRRPAWAVRTEEGGLHGEW